MLVAHDSGTNVPATVRRSRHRHRPPRAVGSFHGSRLRAVALSRTASERRPRVSGWRLAPSQRPHRPRAGAARPPEAPSEGDLPTGAHRCDRGRSLLGQAATCAAIPCEAGRGNGAAHAASDDGVRTAEGVLRQAKGQGRDARLEGQVADADAAGEGRDAEPKREGRHATAKPQVERDVGERFVGPAREDRRDADIGLRQA